MTIEKLEKLVSESKQKKAALAAEVENLLRQESALDAEARAAADVGDVEGYLSKKEEKDKVSATLFVKRNFLDKMTNAVTKDDSRSAWENYVADYNKRMKAAYSDFKAEKAKLCEMYSGMVDLQREALEVRERLADLVGDKIDSYRMEFIPVKDASSRASLRLGGVNFCDPDAAFYLSNYVEKTGARLFVVNGERDPEEHRITSVVIVHNSR